MAGNKSPKHQQCETFVRGSGKQSVHGVAKFHEGQLVYNRDTDEHGFVTGVWAEAGATTYEVWVPIEPKSWAEGHWISHWVERVLKISSNKRLGPPTQV